MRVEHTRGDGGKKKDEREMKWEERGDDRGKEMGRQITDKRGKGEKRE